MYRAARSVAYLSIKTIYVGLSLVLLFTEHAMAIEEPKYEVIQADGSFEIRKYAPILIAETFVDGDMDEASSKGFRLIADFIFGNNQVSDLNASSKIAMTAPVTAEPVSRKIAMTAPARAEPLSSEATMQSAKKWRIHFVMPSQFTLANIPKPKNEAVTLREIPSKFLLVHSYSGFNNVALRKRPEQKSPQLHSLLHIYKNYATTLIKHGFFEQTVFC